MAFGIIVLILIVIFIIVMTIKSHNEAEEMRYQETQRQERERRLKIEETSNVFWSKLEILNNQYCFLPIEDSYHLLSCGEFRFKKNTNSHDFLMSSEKKRAYLAGQIYSYYDWFSIFVQNTEANLKTYKEYRQKVEILYTQYYLAPTKQSDELLKIKILKEPIFPDIILEVKKSTYLGYGETKYDYYTYRYAFFEIYKLVLDKKGKTDFIKEERAKMSDSLRYSVLCRDNFCCVLCGKSRKNGVSLEIDHIIPVSKGGRTELDNLQTLCERCNRGKRDEMPTKIPAYTRPVQVVSKPTQKPTMSQESTIINNPIYNSPTQTTCSNSKISKIEAQQLCIKNNIPISPTITFASSNNSESRKYWAYPNISVLCKDWTLILNDKIRKKLHIFRIPAGHIKEWQLEMRNDSLIDLQINYNDNKFQDSRSYLAFAPWYIQTLSY